MVAKEGGGSLVYENSQSVEKQGRKKTEQLPPTHPQQPPIRVKNESVPYLKDTAKEIGRVLVIETSGYMTDDANEQGEHA